MSPEFVYVGLPLYQQMETRYISHRGKNCLRDPSLNFYSTSTIHRLYLKTWVHGTKIADVTTDRTLSTVNCVLLYSSNIIHFVD